MSIRKLLGCGLMLIALILSACAAEEEPYFDDSEVQFSGAGCLAETFSDFDLFLEGRLKNQEVAAFWDCANTALLAFERRVEGSGENGNFKSTELRRFVGRYFLKSGSPEGIEISDVLLDELMEIKRQFLGGSRTSLTREELNQTKTLVKEFKYLSIRINPYIRLLFYNDQKTMPAQQKLAAGIQSFSELVERVGALIGQQSNAYEFSRLIRLFEELEKVFEEKDKTLPDWVKYIPTVQRVKALFLNSSESQIDSGEWRPLARVLGDGLSVFFRAKHFFRSEALYDLTTVGQFSLMYGNVDRILREALSRRGGSPFSNEDFNAIVESLDEAEILPNFLSVQEIQNLWGVLVDKVLTPDERLEDGLATKELNEAQSLFNNWYLSQRWLIGEPQDDSVIQEIDEVLDTPWPYRTDSEGRLIFDDNKMLSPNIESTTQLNWERAAFKLVLRGYIEDPEERRARQGLNRDELDVAFADLRPVFVQLGLIEEDDENFIGNASLQSSLFLPRSNGDQIFDFFEMIEYAHFVLGGIEMGKRFLEVLPEECMVDDEIGYVDYECWRAGFREFFPERYANMPFMVEFVESLSDREFYKFMDGLESATRNADVPREYALRSDIYEAGIFMQYIETIMFRFDVDRSSRLNIEEGLAAVPLFTPKLKELTPFKSDREIRILLTFMMRYGATPFESPLNILRYLHWRWTENRWKINTGRGEIVQILSSLSDFL